MKVSIVIPVYNEAEHLSACLSAIAAQTVRPLEVIVVDNNSTDGTAAIAGSYDFVKLMQEPRQGVVHARNLGFDTARGDIIGRIDADTLLPPSWTAQVIKLFKSSGLAAVSGAAHYYDFALAGVADSIDYRLRGRLAQRLGQHNFLWGANMAIRRSVWRQVRPQLCMKRDLHEDFDLGIHVQALGHVVVYDPALLAGVSSRRIDSGFVEYLRYTLVSPRTYARHQLHGWRHMYPVLLTCWSLYLPARVIYRAYDPATEGFSFNRLLAPTPARVDPTANVL